MRHAMHAFQANCAESALILRSYPHDHGSAWHLWKGGGPASTLSHGAALKRPRERGSIVIY